MADDIDDSLEEALALFLRLGYSDVLVSGGSRIFERGGLKNNGCLLSLRRQINSPKNKRWEVVQQLVLLQKDLFFFGGGGGGILHMHIHFPMGPHPSLAQNGGEHIPELPPLDPDPHMLVYKL